MELEKLQVTEAQWKTMQKAVKLKAIKQRKLYPEEHENANEVGCEWTRSKGLHNRDKSQLRIKN